jgi:hypothetical protein
MTRSEIRAMFMVGKGKVWLASRTGANIVIHGNAGAITFKNNDVANERRRIVAVRSKDVVWARQGKEDVYMDYPKASEILEARAGYLKFKYAEGPIVELVMTGEDVP